MNIPKAALAISSLLVMLFVCTSFLSFELWQQHLWKEEVSGLAAYQGVIHAKEDFQQGTVGLFVLVDDRSGGSLSVSNDGPYRIQPSTWHPKNYPSRYVAEKVVESYNRRMKSLHDHPEWYVAETNAQGRIIWK